MLSRIKIAFSLLRRHLRIAGTNPSRWLWVLSRVLRIGGGGGVGATLARHAADQELYGDYPAWRQQHLVLTTDDRERIAKRIAEGGDLPLLSVMMPVYNTPPAWLDEAVRSVRDQVYPRWELCIVDDCSTNAATTALLRELTNSDSRIRSIFLDARVGIGLASNAAIDMAKGEFVVLLDHDDILSPEALYLVWEASRAFPDVQMLYSDEDKLGEGGQPRDPHFKPSWDPDLALGMNYLGHMVAIRRTLLREVGGFAPGLDGAQDWDLLLRCSERVASGRIRHIPRVLYHWRVHRNSTAAGLSAKPDAEQAQRTVIERALQRRGIVAEVIRTHHGWRVRRAPVPDKSVSVVVQTRGRADLLQTLLARLAEYRRDFDLDIVVIDHEANSAAVAKVVDGCRSSVPVRLLTMDGPFNFARLCNFGVANARGEFIVLLDDDVLPESGEWLRELIAQAARPEVGIVGGLLRYPDGRLQHAGELHGINGPFEHIWRGYSRTWGGIHGRARQVQEMTAVTAACLAMRREVWQRLGGMDESFARTFNGDDLCLRVHASGLKVLFTPFAEAMRDDSATRGQDDSPELEQQYRDEVRHLRERWKNVDEVDARYNPCLASSGMPFALSPDPAAAAPWREPTRAPAR